MKYRVLMSLVILTACGGKDKKNPIFDPAYVTYARLEAQRMALVQPEIRSGMDLYASCDALAADLNESARQRWVEQKANISDSIANYMIYRNGGTDKTIAQDAAAPTAETTTSNSAGSATDTATNVQESGVDEADSFRVGRDQIFALSFGKIQVINRANLQLLGTIDISSDYNPRFFTKDDRLVVLSSVASATPDPVIVKSGASTADSVPASSPAYPGYGYGQDTKVTVYQTAAGQMPRLLTESTVSGSYVDSRLLQNQLVLILQAQAQYEQIPVTIDDFADEEWIKDPEARRYFQNWGNMTRDGNVKLENNALAAVPCDHYMQRRMADWDTSLSKILTIDITQSQNPAQNLGIIGQGGQIYMSTDSLYLLKTQVQWFSSTTDRWNWYGQVDEKTLIQQVSVDGGSGAVVPLAAGEAKGRIKDRWSLRGFNGGKNLAIASTTGFTWNSENPSQNHLTILESDAVAHTLNVVGSVNDFGTNEDIKSVRYVENIAYVVTFRQTDPLFAIDIADPKAPKMLSGLKVPGFSSYMHPLASGRLLGVGFDAFETGQIQGVQVSLFDTSDPTAMARLDNKTYGVRGSSTEVTMNPHAFFYDSASQLIGLPLVELYNYGSLKFTGAQLLGFDGQTLVEKGRVTHRDWIPPNCLSTMSYGGYSLDINRLYRVDDRLITLSAYGMKAYDLANFTVPTFSVPFQVDPKQCFANQGIPL